MESKNVMIAGILVALLAVGGLVLWQSSDSDDEAVDTATNTTQTTQANNSASEVQEAPAPSQDIVELAQGTESLSILVAAVVQEDLVGTLSSEGPFTVFAPNDEAFGDLLAQLDITAEELLAREDLSNILTYHVVPAKAMSGDLVDGQKIATVNGGEVTVTIENGVVMIDDAKVIAADVEATNGVVHVIDKVLLP